jgi:methionyl-tRNA synthetase
MGDAPDAASVGAPAQGDKAFYVTVAIDYPNGEPHVGHAYEKVAADALVRYARLRGRPAYYLMGNDEHSQNVVKAARDQGLDPETYCVRMAQLFRSAWDSLGIRYDQFMRTGDPRHATAVRTLVQRLYDRGHVYRGTYSGWYCVSCEAFITEKEVEGGLCPVHKRPVERVEEHNWFFRLSAFRDAVLRHVTEHPDFVQPDPRRNEVLNVLREGLEDISISRARTEWGVPLPWDSGQVVYVWFDALITYLSGAGFGWDEERFGRVWPADVHLIGKDITRFHCVIWPAMLLAAGLPLPRTVYGHGFLNVRGEKLSKTTGNIVDPVRFRARYGTDATRWYLLAETPFGQDGNFAPETFVKRYNSDLANDLGNLLSRGAAARFGRRIRRRDRGGRRGLRPGN